MFQQLATATGALGTALSLFFSPMAQADGTDCVVYATDYANSYVGNGDVVGDAVSGGMPVSQDQMGDAIGDLIDAQVFRKRGVPGQEGVDKDVCFTGFDLECRMRTSGGCCAARKAKSVQSRLQRQNQNLMPAAEAHVFPAAVEAQAEAAKPVETLGKREDWRRIPLITIDPPDAKDHGKILEGGKGNP